eukprot:Gb_41684 [translate_table: standard]
MVSHGLTSRDFLLKWSKWTAEKFELLNNPHNFEIRLNVYYNEASCRISVCCAMLMNLELDTMENIKTGWDGRIEKEQNDLPKEWTQARVMWFHKGQFDSLACGRSSCVYLRSQTRHLIVSDVLLKFLEVDALTCPTQFNKLRPECRRNESSLSDSVVQDMGLVQSYVELGHYIFLDYILAVKHAQGEYFDGSRYVDRKSINKHGLEDTHRPKALTFSPGDPGNSPKDQVYPPRLIANTLSLLSTESLVLHMSENHPSRKVDNLVPITLKEIFIRFLEILVALTSECQVAASTGFLSIEKGTL